MSNFSEVQRKSLLEAIESQSKKNSQSKEAATESLKGMGFLTSEGNLSPDYGGPSISSLTMVTVRTVMIEELRKLYQTYPWVGYLFDKMANLDTDLVVLHARDVVSYVPANTRWEAFGGPALFQKLDELRLGVYTVGRKGAETRIVFNFSLRSIGQVASGKSDTLLPFDPKLMEEYLDSVKNKPHKSEPKRTSVFTIADAKRLLAESCGVLPENIEIIIRG